MQNSTHLTFKKGLMLLLLVLTGSIFGQVEQKQETTNFLPEGFVIYKEIQGDLNGDDVDDHVVIVKGTEKEKIVINRFDKEVDRNRRGILIYLTEIDKNNLVVENLQCFLSENEDGGAYYAPQLSMEIKEGKLYVDYEHGRYGYWSFIFQYRNSDFELVEYDGNYSSHVIPEEANFDHININFLNKELSIFELSEIGETEQSPENYFEIKETIKVEEAPNGEEITYKTISKKMLIDADVLMKLSEIDCFGDLEGVMWEKID